MLLLVVVGGGGGAVFVVVVAFVVGLLLMLVARHRPLSRQTSNAPPLPQLSQSILVAAVPGRLCCSSGLVRQAEVVV